MNIVDIILNLLMKFIPYDEKNHNKIKEGLISWWASIEDDGKPELLKRFKKYNETWYGLIGNSILYLILYKEIIAWKTQLNEANEELEEKSNLF